MTSTQGKIPTNRRARAGSSGRSRSAVAASSVFQPGFERLERRCVMSGVAPFTAGTVPLSTDPSVTVSGNLPEPGSQQLYQVTLDAEGLLVANLQASGSQTLLSLENSRGNVLIQGEATSATDPTDRVAQHLPAGSYFLAVSNLSNAVSFQLSTSFTQALTPGASISETSGAYQVTSADLKANGKADLIVPDYYYNQVLINYGLGDGTFQAPVAIPAGIGPVDVIAADLFGDGHLDLVVVDQLSNDVTIFRGDGQGDFVPSQVLATRSGPVSVVSGDFSGDGRLDLAVAIQGAGGVELFHNQGDGTFVDSSWIGSISRPVSLTVAHLNGETHPHLAVASAGSGTVILLDGQGDDQFTPAPYQLPVGLGITDVIAAPLSGGSQSDLAADDTNTGVISIFHFDGFAYHLVNQLQAGSKVASLAAADFNGDGKIDLAAVNQGDNNVSVFLSNGNATFGSPKTYDTGSGPVGLVSGDYNVDGFADLVTTDFLGLSVSVLLNHGDATFASPPSKPASAGPEDVLAADLTGNGIQDLIIPDVGLNAVEILLGRGDGTFRDPILIPAGQGPEGVAVGDFNGDGIPDLAVTDYYANTITILQGMGDASFQPIETLPTDGGPEFIKTADLTGNGHLDLVVANYLGNDIGIYYGKGDGTFSSPVTVSTGQAPSGIAIADLNGDGRPDIAVSNSGSDNVEVLLASGLMSYSLPLFYPAGAQPWEVAVGDFNQDGHPDLVVADGLSSPSTVSLLINAGNGTFLAATPFGVGGSPYPLTVGDLNGDGHLDIVIGNDGSNDLSVLMGRGDGTFAPEIRLPAGSDPYGLAVADLTGNGHLDIIDVNYQSSDLTIEFGNGDGTFQSPTTVPLVSTDLPTITAKLEGNGVPQVLVANPETGLLSIFSSQGDGTLQLIDEIRIDGTPSGIVVGDFNGDGRPDLAVTDSANGRVLIFLGLGDGTFEDPVAYAVGKSPRSPLVGDFAHNGILDIAVADTNSNQLSILYGNGDGTFQPSVSYSTGEEPISLVDEDLTGNGVLLLGTINRTSHDVTALIPSPIGGYATTTFAIPNITASAILSGDINGDGLPDTVVVDQTLGMLFVEIGNKTQRPIGVPVPIGVGHDLITLSDLYHDGQSDVILANQDTGVVTVLSHWSNGAFQSQTWFHVDVAIAGLAVVDLNDDGLPDILITQAGTGLVETYLSGGNGLFSAAVSTLPLPHPSPLIFPSSPGVSNIVSTDNNGQILERFGVKGATAQFSAPLNQTLGTGEASRDYAVVKTVGHADVALLTTSFPLVVLQDVTNVTASGRTSFALPNVGIYTRLISGDLFGRGIDDLVLINRTLNEIFVFEQVGPATFQQYGNPIAAGFGPTDVTLANLTPGGLPDLVVADGASGTVTIIGRDGQGGFFNEATLPGGLATAGTVLLPGGLQRSSPDLPVGLASGVFTPSGLTDVAVIDHGTDRLSILQGLPGGELAAPSLALTYATGLDPIEVIAAPLTRSGLLDLIVLNEGSHDISIFLNNGQGGFTALPRIDAGDNPISLTVRDVTGDGVADLVVGNDTGDILILAGKGDGSFQPYERADGTVSLAVGDLTGNGQNDFVLTNTSQDLLSVQTPGSSTGFLQGRGNGLLAPGPVAIADMNGDGIADLIVTNTGGNDILVYLGLGGGRFAAPQEFFTGTSPVGLTVAHLTQNPLPDLIVANSGSNDVTILLGTTDASGNWTMKPGPRLKAGNRPVSTTVAHLFGKSEVDILVVNQESDDVTVLRGLGGGFFNDVDPLTLAAGKSPVEAFVGHFSNSLQPGIVILNSLSNDMTFYANVSSAPSTISSGGIDPLAGVVGDFNNDGYTDLAVADNGDSRIALFDGSSIGLALAQTILLGASTRPTDLVVSRTDGGGVRFFVGASGQNQAIAVAFAVQVTTIVALGPSGGDGGPVNSGAISRASSTGQTTSSQFNAFLFEQAGSLANTQSQESTAAPASGGSTGALGLAVALVSTLNSAVQPLFSPSARSLGWLLDNLVQFVQGQTAEILPVGKNEMAAVAVLLSASNIANPLDEKTITPLPVATEDDAPTVIVSPFNDDQDPTPPSTLDRFVADLGRTPVDLSRESRPGLALMTDLGPEWVWHRRSADPDALTVTFDEPRDHVFTARSVDQAEERAIVEATESSIEVEVFPSNPLEGSSGLFSTLGLASLSTIALTIGLAAAGRLGWARLTRRRNRQALEAEPSGSSFGGRGSGPNDRTIFGPSRSKIRQDLPPWLQAPMGPRHRPTLAIRTLGSTFLKRNDQEP